MRSEKTEEGGKKGKGCQARKRTKKREFKAGEVESRALYGTRRGPPAQDKSERHGYAPREQTRFA